jgi:hypothetical protein
VSERMRACWWGTCYLHSHCSKKRDEGAAAADPRVQRASVEVRVVEQQQQVLALIGGGWGC